LAVHQLLITTSSSKEKIASNIGILQVCLMIGQLLDHTLGAMLAAIFDYRASFVSVSAILLAAALLCEFKIREVPQATKTRKVYYFL